MLALPTSRMDSTLKLKKDINEIQNGRFIIKMSFQIFINLNSYNSEFLLFQTIVIPNNCHFEYIPIYTTLHTQRPRKLVARSGHICDFWENSICQECTPCTIEKRYWLIWEKSKGFDLTPCLVHFLTQLSCTLSKLNMDELQ